MKKKRAQKSCLILFLHGLNAAAAWDGKYSPDQMRCSDPTSDADFWSQSDEDMVAPTPSRCPANEAHIRQSKPDSDIRQSEPGSGLAFQVKVLGTCYVVPSSFGSGSTAQPLPVYLVSPGTSWLES